MISLPPLTQQLLTLIGLLNALVRPLISGLSQAHDINAWLSGLGIHPVIWLAAALALRASACTESLRPGPLGWLSIAIACALFLLPSATLAWIGLTLWSAYRLTADKSGHRGYWILLLLSLRAPLSSVLLQLFTAPLLALDAWLVVGLSELLHWDFVQQDNLVITPNGMQLVILTGCSSYQNLSLTLLGWFAVTRFCRASWSAQLTLIASLLAVGTFALNILRLLLMATSPEHYEFFHHGVGASSFDLLQVILTTTFLFWSCYAPPSSDNQKADDQQPDDPKPAGTGFTVGAGDRVAGREAGHSAGSNRIG